MAKTVTTHNEFVSAKYKASLITEVGEGINLFMVGIIMAILSADEKQGKKLAKSFPSIYKETMLRKNSPDGRLVKELSE